VESPTTADMPLPDEVSFVEEDPLPEEEDPPPDVDDPLQDAGRLELRIKTAL